MDSAQNDPLSVAEAKQRLRLLAEQASPAGWIRNKPWDAMAIAFVAGLLAGAEPKARKPLAEALAHLLAQGLISSGTAPKHDR